MKPFNSVSSLFVKYNGLFTHNAQPISIPEVMVKSYRLESCRFLPGANEAICRVRDLATGALRQVLASRLLLMPFGKEEAYLLECVKARTMGGQ